MTNVNKYQKKVDDYYFDYSYSEDLMALQKDLNDYAESIGAPQVEVRIEDHCFYNRGIPKDEPSWEIWIFFNEQIGHSATVYSDSFSGLFKESKKAMHYFLNPPKKRPIELMLLDKVFDLVSCLFKS